eukprot:scaffold991_cov128-Cylindrotheca_fusiformis.AAC.25
MTKDGDYLYTPTTSQQKAISLLVIPPSILSLIGSCLIIVRVRLDQKWTPYRRLLLALSVCDIIYTVSCLSQPFLMNSKAINSYVWSFGNGATCTGLGAVAQLGITSHLYSATLSMYFLLTIRYGVREETFTKRYERWIHGLILLFGLVTATVSCALGLYDNRHVGPGCWISQPSKSDSYDVALKMAWISGGIPILLVLMCIAGSNCLLYLHIRSTVLKHRQQALRRDTNKESICEEDTSERSRKSHAIQTDKHWKRVQDVGKQPFLYVGAYVVCYAWTIAMSNLDGQGFEKKEGSGAYFLPLLILQSIFLPAQGLFNAIIFFRPKYNQVRTEFPDETKLWSTKRTLWGAAIKSTSNPLNRNIVDLSFSNERESQEREMSAAEEKCRIQTVAVSSTAMYSHCSDAGKFIQGAHTLRDKMSSLTESENDFDKPQVESQTYDRWGVRSAHSRSLDVPPTHRSMSFKKTALDLDEHSASLGGNHTMAAASIGSTDTPTDTQIPRKLTEVSEYAESRWCAKVSPNRRHQQDATTDSLGIPERHSTDSELSDSKHSLSSDTSSNIQAPQEG